MALVATEVIEAHDFFSRWFRGEAESEDLERMRRSLALEFRMVAPSGQILSRAEIVDRVARAYGQRDLEVSVEDIQVEHLGEAYLATYVERQRGADGATTRWSSAIFRVDETGPNGVVWTHLHETWIDGP